MKMKTYLQKFVILWALLLSLTAAGCQRQNQDVCCIKISDSCVSVGEFREQMERFAEESLITSMEMINSMKPMIVDQMVEERLILKFAEDNLISVTDEEVEIALNGFLDGLSTEDVDRMLTEECRTLSDIRSFIRNRTIINKAVDKHLKKKITVGTEDIRGYYEEHRAQYMRQASVELYHVFVKEKNKAREALVMLRSNIPLAEVVRRYSESADAGDNGFMGVFVRGELPPEVEEVVFTIPERRYSGIIESMRGYHIFYVEKRTQAGQIPLTEVSEEIKEKIVDQRLEKKYSDWLEELKQTYEPEVDWDEINKISIK